MTEHENPLGRVVAKALADEAFKQRLIADPAAALAAEGLNVPEGISVKVVEDTTSERHLVLPAVGAGKLADAELGAVVGGITTSCFNVWWTTL